MNLSQNELMIVEHMRLHPEATTKEIAEHLSISLRSVQRTIHALKERGVIEFKGTRKKGIWIVRE